MGQVDGGPIWGIENPMERYGESVSTWGYIETIFAKKDEAGRWQWSAIPSPYFQAAFGNEWNEQKTVSYFLTFWSPVFDALDNSGLVCAEVDVLFGYAQAVATREQLSEWLDEWAADTVIHRSKNSIAIEERDGDRLVAVLAQLQKVVDVRPLSPLEV